MTGPLQTPSTEVELRFERLGVHGDAVTEFEGKPLYVSNVVPGERALVRIRKRYRTAAVAELIRVIEPSADRETPPCPLFHGCSGCQLQHIRYARQLELKRIQVADACREAGLEPGVILETLGAAEPWHYRNNGRFTVRDGKLGFIHRRPRQFIAVDRCLIMRPEINDLLAHLQGQLKNATQCNIRVGDGAEVMIQPRLTDLDIESGQAVLHETLDGHRFRISGGSFFQVNTRQAECLVQLVAAQALERGPGLVIDAYAGVGTFAWAVAKRGARVIAIEESEAAMADARINLAGIENVELRVGKTEAVLPQLGGPVTTVIIDPPRSGCRPEALQAIGHLDPLRVVYVSCDPESLVRDLRTLVAYGYRISQIQPLDMFPHTRHIEVIATLDRESMS